MNEQIKAGSDIHAGDGGYSISTKEKYEAFVKLRNQSMNGKLKELMIEAGYAYPEGATRAHKLAELIVRECIDKIETHRIPVGNSAAGEMACEWTYSALKEIRDEIKEHFGVEE